MPLNALEITQLDDSHCSCELNYTIFYGIAGDIMPGFHVRRGVGQENNFHKL